ncbi:acetyltransferase [compost metagenome]
MKLKLIESNPSVDEYMTLIASTGWDGILEKGKARLEKCLKENWFSVSVYNEADEIIGYGRILSDGELQALICDVIIKPEFQRKGIGSLIVTRLIEECKKHDILLIQLFSAWGKEDFYIKHGFEKRADEAPGMRYTN